MPPAGRNALGVAALAAAALALRLWGIGAAPLHPDEVHYAWAALTPEETASVSAVRDVADRLGTEERRTAHPALGSLLLRWLWCVPLDGHLDRSPGFLRAFHALLGALTAVAALGAARAAWGRAAGWLAGALVAVSPLLVWVSRTLYLDAPFTLWTALMLWALAAGRRRDSLAWPALAGLAFGAAMSTKISAPLLLPVLALGAALLPDRVGPARRLSRVAVALLAAAGLWLLLCDPVLYLARVIHPADPRYLHYQDAPLVTLLAHGGAHGEAIVTGFPLTLVLIAAVGAVLGRREPFTWLLAIALVALAPLFYLHLPVLSGPHGLAPLVLVLALLGARAAALPRGACVALAGVHVVMSLALVAARAGGHGEERDPVFRALRPWLSGRHPSAAIVLDLPAADLAWRHTALIRSVQIAGGAVIWTRRPGVDQIGPGAWDLADVVVSSAEAVRPAFEAASIPGTPWTRFVRQDGGPVRAWRLRDLPAVSDIDRGTRAFPGGVRPLAGRVLWDGHALALAASPEGAAFEGFRSFGDWGTGLIRVPESLISSEVEIRVAPPRHDDVFWGH